MIGGWVLLLVALGYLGVLFAIAWYGDRRPLYPSHAWLRPIVYALALAVYCTSWTFYGAVGTAATSGLAYLPIYLGPALVFVFFGASYLRLVRIAQRHHTTSIADFVASRFGKSRGLAVLITLIALVAAVPYVALQFKAVAMSVAVLTGTDAGDHGPILADTALYVALLLALFSILFGTRAVDATEHHHGLMLAIAVESLVKLVAFAAVGIYAWGLLASDASPLANTTTLPAPTSDTFLTTFATQTLLAATAIVCLPRQFQVGVVECEDLRDVRRARYAFPLYLAAFTLLVLPIALAGLRSAPPATVHPDSFVLWLPASRGDESLALLAYIGGFSAATGMVIVASVALATMISNELVLPALARVRALRLGERGDLSRLVLWIRRLAIVALAAMAYSYYRLSAGTQSLAAVGLLAFAAVAQFAPAIVGGLYLRSLTRAGVIAGMAGGFALWLYTLFLPSLSGAGLMPDRWLVDGPGGIGWLHPHALLGWRGIDPLAHGTAWSLGINVALCLLVSRLRPASIQERLRAGSFLAPAEGGPLSMADNAPLPGRTTVADLLTLAARIVGERAADAALAEFNQLSGRRLGRADSADRQFALHVERALSGAVGATSARLVLTTALRGTGMEVDEVATMLDQTSQELRFNRELLQATLQNMTQGIAVVDAELRLVAWNRRYLELFRYPEGMVRVGCPVAELIRWNARRGEWGPGDPEAHVAKRIGHLTRATPYAFQRERSDGSVLEMRGEPMPGGGFVTTYTDVTDYKRVESALRQLTQELEARVETRTQELRAALEAQRQAKHEAEAANQSKTRFVAAASHDLLQPLNAARLFSSALRARPGLDGEVGKLAERVDISLRAAEELLDGLLDISRLDSGAMRAEISPFAARELLEAMAEQFAPLAASRGLQLHVHPCSAWVLSDRRLLRRVLQNLLSNALRYTASGRVVLGCRRRGPAQLEFVVADTGPGIAPQHRRLVFEEFQRLELDSPWGEKGLGLGLSICERIARLLGHALTLHSEQGRGTRFGLRVPRSAADTAAFAREATPPAASIEGLRVLCLDNDRAILDGMQALLERWGVLPLLAATLDEAGRALAARVPDVILADYHLHDRVEGLDALDQLRARCGASPPPGALITADASDALAEEARRRGYALLRKPVRPAALRALLAALAATRRSGGDAGPG